MCTLKLVHICTSISDRILHVDSEEQPAGRICSLFITWFDSVTAGTVPVFVSWFDSVTSGTVPIFVSWFYSNFWHRASFYIVV